MSPHALVLIAWSLLLVGIGFVAARRAGGVSGFFVARRRLSGTLVFATVLAANIGAGSTVGAAALGYRHGLAAWWWVGAAGFATLLLAVWLGPRLWSEARRHDLRTVGDFLELRFGPRVRAALAALLWVATLFVLAAQLMAAGVLIEAATGAPFAFAVFLAGAVMTAYFVSGGLQSAAWVNLVQVAVVIVGLSLAVPFALQAAAAGTAGVSSGASALGDSAFDVFADAGLAFRYAALLIPAFLVSPGILQKLFGARDRAAVRRGLLAAGVGLLLFAAAPPLLGVAARVLHPDLVRPDAALPVLLLEDVPVWLGCLGVAALFSAEVSSADAVLFMLSTSLSRDLYQRFLRPDAGEAQVLRAARAAAVLGGLLGVVLAIVGRSVIESLSVFYALLGVSLFVPVVAGLHRVRLGGRAVLVGAGVGVVVFAAASHLDAFSPPLFGITGAAVSAAIVGLVRRSQT